MEKTGNVEKISNGLLEFSFEASCGELVSIRNLRTGNEYLNEPGRQGNPFAVYYDFFQDFELTCDRDGFRSGSNPGTISRKTFSPGECSIMQFRRVKTRNSHLLKIIYTENTGLWKAELSVRLKSGSTRSAWNLTITNTGKTPMSCMVAFPFICGLRLGNGRDNLMVANEQAGYIFPLWSRRGGIYGHGYQMSMQWGCIFDEKSRDAFGFIVQDGDFSNKEMLYDKPSVEIRYFPPQTLEPGESRTLPPSEILIYEGGWKETALAYHAWFARAAKPVRHPEWVKKMDSHVGQWFVKKGQDMTGYPTEGLANPMESFRELPDVYRRLHADTIEFAFFCRGSMGKTASGKEMTHTDADNIIREDLGGKALLKKAITEVHRMGSHFTFYIDGYVCPADSDLALNRRVTDWVIMEKNGTWQTDYINHPGWMQMCPGARGWQDHLAGTAARLVRETGADGVRIDSFGGQVRECHNPQHRHKNPFDFNRWTCELMEKIARAVKKVNPGCLLTTETPVDFYCRYFNGALTQLWHVSPLAAVRDVSPMRVAVPEYFLIVHNPSGPVAASLTGYPGGFGGNTPGGYFSELDEKWRRARFPVGDIIRWGDASHENPIVSRTDVFCRHFSGRGLDVIIGARPLFDDMHKLQDIRDVDLKKTVAAFDVTFPHTGKRPAAVYFCDIRKGSLEEIAFTIKGKCVKARIASNWFMLITANTQKK
ncbi:MAG: DUF6259 domain-containing protein [Candidatus Omnitrophota bacterium]